MNDMSEIKEKQHKRCKEYYKQNKEKCLERSKEWYKRNYRTHQENHKRWAERNPEQIKKYQRAQKLKKYGLTFDTYDNLWIEQMGLCPICRLPLPAGYSARVDHDHKTGKVRGLLHGICNQGLGLFKEDAIRLTNALNYLESI